PQVRIPLHTHTSFGKGDEATYVDYLPFIYHTGDITKTELTSPKTGIKYHIARALKGYYGYHDPELEYNNDPENPNWFNTLSIDEVSKERAMNWAYAPNCPDQMQRGYAMEGQMLISTPETYGWSVWVR